MKENIAELVTYLAKCLVQEPEKVTVTAVEDDDAVTLELRVAPDDIGRVIGKQGRIAKAIRTVVKSAAGHEDKKYTVEIVE